MKSFILAVSVLALICAGLLGTVVLLRHDGARQTKKDKAGSGASSVSQPGRAPGSADASDDADDPPFPGPTEPSFRRRPSHLDKIDDATLIAWLIERGSASDPEEIDKLIRQLGDDDFGKREEASKRLVLFGEQAYIKLKVATKSRDIEVARRAESCRHEIVATARDFGRPIDVLREVLKRHAKQTVEALVTISAAALHEDELEEIYFALDRMLGKEGKPLEPCLLSALTDKSAPRRALAGLLVGRYGNAEQRKRVTGLLEDADAEVRLRAAQGLLASSDASGLPRLIALLESAPQSLAWEAEELLHYAAGADSPHEVLGAGSARERAACRRAWEDWWKAKGKALDMVALARAPRQPRLLLVIQAEPLSRKPEGRLRLNAWLCGCESQPRAQPLTIGEIVKEFLPHNSQRTLVESKWSHVQLALQDDYQVLVEPDGTQRAIFDESLVLDIGNRIEATAPAWRHMSFRDVRSLRESDPNGLTVWEAFFEGDIAALLVCPRVRVGFSAKGRDSIPSGRAENLNMFKDPNPLVRRFALQYLADFPSDEETLLAVGKALKDPDAGVRECAVKLLSQDGWHNALVVPDLVARLGDADDQVAAAAKTAVRVEGAQAVPLLLHELADKDSPRSSRRRSAAAGLLAQFGPEHDDEMMKVIHNAFSDDDPNVRAAAVTGVGRRRFAKADLQEAWLSEFARCFTKALDDPADEVREQAEYVYWYLGAKGSAGVDHFLSNLRNGTREILACTALPAIGKADRRVVPALLDRLAHTKPRAEDIRLRGEIARALGGCATQENMKSVLAALRELLEDETPDCKPRQDPPTMFAYPVQREALVALRALHLGKGATSLSLAVRRIASNGRNLASNDALEFLNLFDPRAAESAKEEQERTSPMKFPTGPKPKHLPDLPKGP